MENRLETIGHRLVLLAGALVGLLGSIVLVGWWVGAQALVQIYPSFVPMQFNTALALLLAGLGTAALAARKPVAATVLGAAVTALGLSTASQYVLNVDLGIDQLFMEHHVTVGTSHPGRMAPNTALCFGMSGLALILLGLKRFERYRHSAAQILGSLVAGIALVGLFGYATGIEDAYGWGHMTRMAVHTAAGFWVLGNALFLVAWLTDVRGESRSARGLSLPIAIAALAVLLSLWQALSAHDERRVFQATDAQLAYLRSVIDGHLEDRLLALERMAARWEAENGTPRGKWEADAARLNEDYDGYLSIGWAGANATGEWRVPQTATPVELESLQLGAAFRLAADRGSLIVVPAEHPVEGRTSILAVVPVRAHGRADGYLFGVLNLQGRLPARVETVSRHAFVVLDGAREVFRSAVAPRTEDRWMRQAALTVRNATWTLQVWPTQPELAALRSPLSAVVLSSGVAVALLLLAAIHFAQMATLRARRLERLTEQLQETQRNLERLALYDSLTDLGNRNLFLRELKHALASASRNNQGVGLLLMDLDGFKAVNDRFGHKAGDVVLQEVGGRISGLLRESDQVFRIGGDEFAVLLQAGTGLEGALVLAQKMSDAMREPIVLYGEPSQIGLSIGVAAFPHHALDMGGLIRKADAAMYQAKKTGHPVAATTDMSATTVLHALQERRRR